MKTRVVHCRSQDFGRAVAAGLGVYIGRAVPRFGLETSPWANPFKVGQSILDINAMALLPSVDNKGGPVPTLSRSGAVKAYEIWLFPQAKLFARVEPRRRAWILDNVHLLQGKVLGCWCVKEGHEPCHGRVLAWLADFSRGQVLEGERLLRAWAEMPRGGLG